MIQMITEAKSVIDPKKLQTLLLYLRAGASWNKSLSSEFCREILKIDDIESYRSALCVQGYQVILSEDGGVCLS